LDETIVELQTKTTTMRVLLSLLWVKFVLGVATRHLHMDDEPSEQIIRLASCSINSGSDENTMRLSCRIGMTSVDYDDNDDFQAWMGKFFWMWSQCEVSIRTDTMTCNVSQSYSGGGYSTTCSLTSLLAGNATSQACTCDSSYRTHTDPYCWATRECDMITGESDDCNECEVRERCGCRFLEDDDYHGIPSDGFWTEFWQAINADDDDNDQNPSIQLEDLINASQPSILHQNIFYNMDVGSCGYESGFQRPLGSRLVIPFFAAILVVLFMAIVALLGRRRKFKRSDSSQELLQEITNISLPAIS
jgi:hypothetical protein